MRLPISTLPAIKATVSLNALNNNPLPVFYHAKLVSKATVQDSSTPGFTTTGWNIIMLYIGAVYVLL